MSTILRIEINFLVAFNHLIQFTELDVLNAEPRSPRAKIVIISLIIVSYTIHVFLIVENGKITGLPKRRIRRDVRMSP